jgi:hypothetical protein
MKSLSDSDSQCIVGGAGGRARRRRLIPLLPGFTPGRGGRRGGGQSLFSQMNAVVNQINIVINFIYGDGLVSVSQANLSMIDMSSVFG